MKKYVLSYKKRLVLPRSIIIKLYKQNSKFIHVNKPYSLEEIKRIKKKTNEFWGLGDTIEDILEHPPGTRYKNDILYYGTLYKEKNHIYLNDCTKELKTRTDPILINIIEKMGEKKARELNIGIAQLDKDIKVILGYGRYEGETIEYIQEVPRTWTLA